MKDFDELLNEVLHERTCSAPKAGMERRILARVHTEQAPPHLTWKTWTALAASALLAGLIVRTVLVPANLTQRAAVSAGMSQITPASVAPATDFRDAAQSQKRAGYTGTIPRMKLKSAKSAVAAVREGSGEIAKLEIAPLSIAPIEVALQGSNKEARKVKPNEDTWWNAVLVCDGSVDSSRGAIGKASLPCHSLVSYTSFPTDAGAQVFGKPQRAAPASSSEHND